MVSRTPLQNMVASLYAKHRVFVSFHHGNDRQYRDAFERMFTENTDVFISSSVQVGEIPANLDCDAVRAKIRDEYLRDSTVTVVSLESRRGSDATSTGRSPRASDARN